MSGKIRFPGLVTLLGLLGALLLLGSSGWGQKRPPAPPADPAIAFVAQKSWAQTDLMVMNADGTNQKVLLAGTGTVRISNHEPCWSPDGSRLAFFSDVQGAGIYIINKDGSGLCKVVAMTEGGSYGAGNPKWSPDGTQILYSDTTGSGLNEDLYLVQAVCGASAPANLTNTPNIAEFYPTWSPDGTRLAACATGDNDAQNVVIYDLQAGEGGTWAAVNPVILTSNGPLAGAFCTEADWAKSSDRIAVSAWLPAATDRDIWIIDLAAPGSPVMLVQTPSVHDCDPSWAPLDAQIVFSRGGGIYRVYPDGTGLARLAAPSKNKSLISPDWRRNP